MLKKILELSSVNTLQKKEQANVNGGRINSCLLECRQDFADCREDGYSNADCFETLMVCRNRC